MALWTAVPAGMTNFTRTQTASNSVSAKRDALVNPLIPLYEARGFHELPDSRGLVLVRALRPDRLALLERKWSSASATWTSCARQADQVHLDARRVTIPHGAMREAVQVEVGAPARC